MFVGLEWLEVAKRFGEFDWGWSSFVPAPVVGKSNFVIERKKNKVVGVV